ncbi:hypothetical protein LINGRAHAP2_LOCUS4271 [Linum grandiflorum]
MRLAAICWNVRKHQNESLFNASKPSLTHSVSSIESDIIKWSSIARTSRPHYNSGPLTLIPPSIIPPPREPSMDFHYDGSFLNDFQKVVYGVVISNPTRSIIGGRAGTLYYSSVIVAEATALLEAAICAAPCEIPCHVFSDSKTIIEASLDPRHRWPWQYYALLGSIAEVQSSALHILFHYTPRNRNSRADYVAKSTCLGILLPG